MSALLLFGFTLCTFLLSYGVYGMSYIQPYPHPMSSFQYIEIIKQCKIDYALDIDMVQTDELLSNYSRLNHGYSIYSQCIKTKWNQDREFQPKGDINMKLRIGLQMEEENKELMIAEPKNLYENCKSQVTDTETTLWEYACDKTLENDTITRINCNNLCYVIDSKGFQKNQVQFSISPLRVNKRMFEVRSGAIVETVTKDVDSLQASYAKRDDEFSTSEYEAKAIYTEE